MKTFTKRLSFYYFFFFICVSCYKGNGGFIPELGVAFKNKASQNRDVFFITAVSEGAVQSDIFGKESIDFSDNRDFTGKYVNHDIQFTFKNGPEAGVTYKGIIDGAGLNQLEPISKIDLDRYIL